MKIKYYTKQQNCFIDEINALSIVIPVDITVNVAKIKKDRINNYSRIFY